MKDSGRPRTLIQAIGNPSRGDDALGPLLLERVPDGPYEKEWVYQLQVEQAEQWSRFETVILIDAHAKLASPTDWHRIEPPSPTEPAISYSTHAMSPEQVLALNQAYFSEHPQVFLLALQATSFELGDSLSPSARLALKEGDTLLSKKLRELSPVQEGPA